jgi:hypothetical protein
MQKRFGGKGSEILVASGPERKVSWGGQRNEL